MTNFICFRFLFKFLESSASQFRKRTASKFHKKFPEKSATTKLWSSLFTVDTVDLHAVWCLSNKNRLEYFAFAEKSKQESNFSSFGRHQTVCVQRVSHRKWNSIIDRAKDSQISSRQSEVDSKAVLTRSLFLCVWLKLFCLPSQIVTYFIYKNLKEMTHG